MAKFAADTNVSVENSLGEIRRTITKYGAKKFAQFEEESRAAIAFEMHDRQVRFIVPLPDRSAKAITHFPNRHGTLTARKPDAAAAAWEQACRQKWRALNLAIKAKLECVESGIETFEQAFMAEIVLPNGRTIGEHYLPQLAQVYKSGKLPPLMLAAPPIEGQEV